MILVDTSVWIDFLNGHDSGEKLLLDQNLKKGNPVCITGIIVTEILAGIKKESTVSTVKDVFNSLPIISPSIETHIQAAEMYRLLRKNGKTIRSIIDCIIAQIAIDNDLEILHKVRDFSIIRSLYTHLKIIEK